MRCAPNLREKLAYILQRSTDASGSCVVFSSEIYGQASPHELPDLKENENLNESHV